MRCVRLLERGYGWELPAMSSLGYKEFRPFFAGRDDLPSLRPGAQVEHACLRTSPDRLVQAAYRICECIAAGPGALDLALREIERSG